MKDLNKVYAESIAKEYAPKTDSKVVALRKLDRKVKLPAKVFTYSFGIVSALLLGIGMCLTMGVIGGGTSLMFGIGIAVGVLGIAGVSLNYPIYRRILDSRKAQFANDIITLAKSITE